jgi:hypothetical protein
MTKSQELLTELDAEIPEYIKKIGEFYVKNMNEKCHLISHHTAKEYHKCDACHKPNILEIFVIEDAKGNRYEVGSDCILSIGNENLLARFKSYEQKRQNISENAPAIDFLDGFLNACENGESPIPISQKGIKRLTTMQDRMCDGLNPLTKQWRLLLYYVNKIQQEQSEQQ